MMTGQGTEFVDPREVEEGQAAVNHAEHGTPMNDSSLSTMAVTQLGEAASNQQHLGPPGLDLPGSEGERCADRVRSLPPAGS